MINITDGASEKVLIN